MQVTVEKVKALMDLAAERQQIQEFEDRERFNFSLFIK
jgi:hypothetical protein